jgi:hypothetical protein
MFPKIDLVILAIVTFVRQHLHFVFDSEKLPYYRCYYPLLLSDILFFLFYPVSDFLPYLIDHTLVNLLNTAALGKESLISFVRNRLLFESVKKL